MAATKSAAHADRMRTMRLHGISRDVFDRYSSQKASWSCEVVAPGYKYNLTDVASAIGVCQLRKARRFQGEREAIAERYSAAFADLPVKCPRNHRPDDTHAWHLYVIKLDLGRLRLTRDEFIERMRAAGVGVSVHFIPSKPTKWVMLKLRWCESRASSPDSGTIGRSATPAITGCPHMSPSRWRKWPFHGTCSRTSCG